MAPIEEQSDANFISGQLAALSCQKTVNRQYLTAKNIVNEDLINNNNSCQIVGPFDVDDQRRAASELPSTAKMAVATATGGQLRSSSLGPANPRLFQDQASQPAYNNVNYMNGTAYDSNYETIDGYSSGRSDDCAITMLENAVRCLDSARNGSKAKQAIMLKNKQEQDYRNSPTRNNGQNKVQYDSITVLAGLSGGVNKGGCNRDTPPPPPPLPRTKSFKERDNLARMKFVSVGDGRASSAPPISPYFYRKLGFNKRLD
jgi:hypothetical protein